MTEQGSRPPYPVRVVRHTPIPLSDGSHLAADLFLPDAPGSFPAIFDYFPYRKDDLNASLLRQHYALAQHGYAALRLDVRGTGDSGGVAVDEYVLQEQLDAVEAIDWMAQQPWCSGNVGMFGLSYGGFNAIQVAMHRPPALKAICPMYFTDNRYTDDTHYKGGTLQMLYDMGAYGLSMVVYNALPPAPQAVGERWAALWEEHLQATPWLLHWLEHPTWDDYWRHGSLCEAYEAIQCAVYLFGGWRDAYTNCNLRTFQHLSCPKKLLIGPWLHALPDVATPGPQIDYLQEMIRFYDYWLKGIDTGVMAEPPLTLYVQRFDEPRAGRTMTSGFWRHEPGWPLDRMAEHPLYLAGDGALQPELPVVEEDAPYTYHPAVGTTFGMLSGGAPFILPTDQREDDAYTLSWTTEPLSEAIEILGYPQAILQLVVTTEIATVCVRLIDVAPDGTAALVTKGVLNLTHRESHAQPAPLVPSQVYRVAVPLDATSWLFEPGHAIRLSLAGADFPNSWPSPHPYTGRVRLGGAGASRLVLPAVAPQVPALPAPQLGPPALFRPTAEVQAERPMWRVTHDRLAGAVEVVVSSGQRTRVGDETAFTYRREVTATVSEQNPACATYRGLCQVVLQRPGQTIQTRARGQVMSTETAFHAAIQLEITIDGFPYHSRSWARSIRRQLL